MQKVSVAGTVYSLGKRIGEGGEGEVYVLQDQPGSAIKIYRSGLRPEREPKVRAMIQAQLSATTKLVAFPAAIATDGQGSFIGFLMRLLPGYRPLHELYSPKSRRTAFPTADYRFVVRAALNVARAVAQVHQTECVIGDFNHSGVLVSRNATVALIDADSFQFSLNGKRFNCVVGVPDFTPPELHGANLRTVERTRIHDAFGLGVAIFQLLAMGKHPYAGRYAGGDISMGEAIAQNRFAFSQARRAETRTTPPPASITLADLPTPVARAFETSFGTDPRVRPDAATWVHLLKELEAGLSHCTKVKSHYYPSAAGKCTWCRIADRSGIDMFPDLGVGHDQMPSGGSFDLDRIWSQVLSIRLPDPEALLPSVRVGAEAAGPAVKEAKRAVLGARALGLAVLTVAAVGFWYASALAIVWIGLGIFGLIKLLGSKLEHANFINAYDQANERARSAELAFLHRIGLAEFSSVRDDTERWIAAYRELDTQLVRELARLKATREARQREAFLDCFMIRQASIPGIGPAKAATLASYGIETAADVTASAVRAVPGFGEVLTDKLISWRRAQEVMFRFNAAPDILDVQFENKARAASATRRAELQGKIRSGVAALQTAPQLLSVRSKQVDSALISALRTRENAARDLRHLGFAVPAAQPLVLTRPLATATVSTPTKPSGAPAAPKPVVGSSVSCPRCGSPMRRRTARRGSHVGRQFWGCTRYPSCRGIRN